MNYYENFLGIRTETDADGAPFCTFDPGPTSIGREGVMHGGAVASLLEAAAFAAVGKALAERASEGGEPMGWQLVSTTVDYLRPGLAVTSFAQARFDKLAGRSASLAVEAWNSDRSKPVATAEMTFIFKKN
jgi:acyl-coenzyme A thioesterase PaaI-like protein